jgi:hypothetical protein
VARKVVYRVKIATPKNGRFRQSTIFARDAEDNDRASDKGDMEKVSERRRVAAEFARLVGGTAERWEKTIEDEWRKILEDNSRFRKQAEAGSPEAAPLEGMRVLDAMPLAIRRPLALVGEYAYAAAWVPVERTIQRSVDARTGNVTNYDPPLVQAETALLILRSDGQAFSDLAMSEVQPLARLGLSVHLPSPLPPGRDWSGAGVKRFLAGERPDALDVFERVVSVFDRFLDFARSLAPQRTMCELSACHVLSSYFLEALNVVGYLWPNGEKGCGKTVFLEVDTEMAYLGQVILAGSSYPCLRDMADYGATLAFDDAEHVMDTRRTDPDKRTLLLAGSRRGATIAVKEQVGDRWVMRHVNTFCPRLFSAIRLPDPVLGSRSIVLPLVRSGDPWRAKANPMNPADWPTDRRRLIDDLWALGLTHLPEIPKWDRLGAELANLSGRNLDPWRPMFAVAAWLQDRHGLEGLYERMEKLSMKYQAERGEIEETDRMRVLFRALLALSAGWGDRLPHEIQPKDVAEAMNKIAKEEDLAEGDVPFTTARKTGWLLKRQRFRRPDQRNQQGKSWELTRDEIVTSAKAYGIEPEPSTG